MAVFEFTAEVWRWSARADQVWAFVSVPREASEQIEDLAEALPPAGFGAVRVRAAIGGSQWTTSVFPGGDGRYSLPVKKAVRVREGLELGDTAQVWIETVDV
ncbi:hypothetical protein FHX74_000795 [Friedmanniella endophytica]|uniref:DUF1905 domain-containing protein n=1 Tax=Microlunatus kandeliicorticis TaxID=1759536 RepID=A0A7W3P4S2_9ACTN|nr:DUF1905 domain-containing protein [Microlunatus kandeliicorticis]MBA8793201.1 hypothetical protein [Microlunatus kandeliicorticis]